jgi:hypothetical protein
MKKLLTEWRKFLKEGAQQPWLSQSPSPELAAAIADNHERSQQHLCDIGRPLDSCDANTDFWLKALSDAGFDARDVRDGLFDDGGEMVGHDWIVISDNGSEIIFDAAADQFDTEPFADKYTEVY